MVRTLIRSGKPASILRRWSTVAAAIAASLILAYWTLYAIVAPVTVWDSHTYNLARLLLAERGGLFGNELWNDHRQESFVWAFDAVHYPLLKIGWGVALPSFLCFIGVLVMVFLLFRESRRNLRFERVPSSNELARPESSRATSHRLIETAERFGLGAIGWWYGLSLLALPTLVFQATSTKNDVAVLFAMVCWFYALWLWRQEKRGWYLVIMAMSLSFGAGAKGIGLVLFALLGVYSLYPLWGSRGAIRTFLFSAIVSFALLGSTETYINNWIEFRNPLGASHFVSYHRNEDGFKGASANLVRYLFGNVHLPHEIWEAAPAKFPSAQWLENTCRNFLSAVSLKDAGHRRGFGEEHLQFRKMGWESSSDYGFLGTLAMMVSLVTLLTGRWRTISWRLAFAGFISLGIISYFVPWMPWNNRFLLLPMVLFTLAFSHIVLNLTHRLPLARIGYLFLLLSCATVYPLYSYNKKPSDIRSSITNREGLFLKERDGKMEMVDHLRSLLRTDPNSILLLHAGEDAWVLPFLLLEGFNAQPVPNLTPQDFQQIRRTNPNSKIVVLTLEKSLDVGRYPGLYAERSFKDYFSNYAHLYQTIPADRWEK